MDTSHFNEAWLQDLNGSDSYNLDSSAHGFIKDDEFLIVPHGAAGAFIETNYGGGANVVPANYGTAAWFERLSADDNNQYRHIVAYNYRSLKSSGIPPNEYALLALLRAQFIKLGLFVGTIEARRVFVNEVTVAAAAVPDAVLTEMRGTINLEMVQFVQKTAPIIASMSAYSFLTRGHH